MSAVAVRPSILLASGLVLGVLGDALLRAPGAPGLNLFMWAAMVSGATVLLHRRVNGGLSTEAAALLALGVVFAGGLVWRDSPALKLAALGGASCCFALPAFRAGAAWIRTSGVGGYVAAVVAAAGHAAFGAALVVLDVDWCHVRPHRASLLRDGDAAAARRGARMVYVDGPAGKA